jgi:hypothetical protein
MAIVLLAGTTAQGNAQNWKFDLGVNGGGSVLTPGLDEQLGVDGGVQMDGGWLTGAQAALWLTPRIGLRANFAYTDRALSFDGRDETLFGENRNLIDDVNLWTGTGDIMLRLAAPSDRFTGTEVLPYLTGGVGTRWVNPVGDNFFVAGDEDREGETFTVAGNPYFLEEKPATMYRAGIGADARFSENTALRFELGDMMWEPPIFGVSNVNGTQVTVSPGDIGDLQHEFYATVGLHMLVGTDRGERVATTASRPRR